MRTLLEVKHEDILVGIAGSTQECMIAKAFNRIGLKAIVDGRTATVRTPDGTRTRRVELPAFCADKVQMHDGIKDGHLRVESIAPFLIEVDIPEEVWA